MNKPDIKGIRAFVFDAYGTVFDFSSVAAPFPEGHDWRFDRLVSVWREKQLQYTWLRTVEGAYADFWQITEEALEFAMDFVGMDDLALRNDLRDRFLELDAFPEASDTMRRLKAAGIRTAILSNGTLKMLVSVVKRTGIDLFLDAVLSVDEVRVYKPHPRAYQLAVDRMGIEPDAVAYVSSNGWDVLGASFFGFRSVWCNRQALPPERLPGAPAMTVTSLEDIPNLLEV